MYAWYQRRKRQVLGAAVAAAAGATAAYCLYKWYYPDSAEVPTDAALTPEALGQDGPSTSAEEAPPSDDPVVQLEMRMREHLQKLQDIGDSVTLPEVQRRLAAKLEALLDVAGLTAQLRSAKAGAAVLRPEEKLELWHELSRRCFLLLLAATWALPALDLLTHVHLTVLGRHLYLETITRDLKPDDTWRLRFPASPAKDRSGAAASASYLPPLSPQQQEALLSYTEFFVSEGLEAMLMRLRSFVDVHLLAADLKAPTTLAMVWRLLSDMLADTDASITPHEWSAWLVPPLSTDGDRAERSPAGHAPTPATSSATPGAPGGEEPCNGAAGGGPQVLRTPESSPRAATSPLLPARYMPGGISDPLQVEVIAEMLLEVRQVVRSQLFVSSLRAAAMSTANLAAGTLETLFQGRSPAADSAPDQPAFPFASVVPWVSQAGHGLLADCARVRAEVASLDEIQQMYVLVYAKGARAG